VCNSSTFFSRRISKKIHTCACFRDTRKGIFFCLIILNKLLYVMRLSALNRQRVCENLRVSLNKNVFFFYIPGVLVVFNGYTALNGIRSVCNSICGKCAIVHTHTWGVSYTYFTLNNFIYVIIIKNTIFFFQLLIYHFLGGLPTQI